MSNLQYVILRESEQSGLDIYEFDTLAEAFAWLNGQYAEWMGIDVLIPENVLESGKAVLEKRNLPWAAYEGNHDALTVFAPGQIEGWPND